MARRPDDGTEGGAERRPTNLLGSQGGSQETPSSGGQPTSGKQPPAPPASKSEDKADVVANLLKQVNEKTDEIGRLCVEVTDLRQNLVEAGRKLGEAKDEVRELDGRRANLAVALSEVQTELAHAKANATFFEGRIGTLDDQLQTAWVEKSRLDKELTEIKWIQPETGREEKLRKFSTRIGELETELAVAKDGRTKAEEVAKAAKEEVEKIKTDSDHTLNTSMDEAQEAIGDLKSEIEALRSKLAETQDKYWDALAEGRGLSGEYLKQIEALKQELASMQVRAEKAEAAIQVETERSNKAIAKAVESVKKAESECMVTLQQMEEKVAKAEAGWFADGASNGATRQSTTDQMAAVPAAKPGIVQRLFGRKGNKEE